MKALGNDQPQIETGGIYPFKEGNHFGWDSYLFILYPKHTLNLWGVGQLRPLKRMKRQAMDLEKIFVKKKKLIKDWYLKYTAAAPAAVASVVSNSMRPHRWQPTRLPRPWDSLGKNTGVGCHFLLQCIKVKSESEVTQSCLTLSDPMDCSPPGPSIHGIFQARVLEWGAIKIQL